MTQKIKKSIFILGSLLTLAGLYLPVTALVASVSVAAAVQPATNCPNDKTDPSDPSLCACPANFDHPLDANGSKTSDCVADRLSGDCSGSVTSSNKTGIDPTDPTKCAPVGDACKGLKQSECLASDPIVKDLNLVVNFLSALVGVVVVVVIVLGGIQYSMAGDNPSAVTAAKQRIINGLIALVAFLLMFSFLQWLIPGGVFG